MVLYVIAGAVVTALVALIVILALFRAMCRVAEPNEALIISDSMPTGTTKDENQGVPGPARPTVLEQLGQPGGVADVGLAAGAWCE